MALSRLWGHQTSLDREVKSVRNIPLYSSGRTARKCKSESISGLKRSRKTGIRLTPLRVGLAKVKRGHSSNRYVAD
jgi:hypothetical protein